MSKAAIDTCSLQDVSTGAGKQAEGGSRFIDEEKRVVDGTTYQETNESTPRSMASLVR
jgi:hypothetical protein